MMSPARRSGLAPALGIAAVLVALVTAAIVFAPRLLHRPGPTGNAPAPVRRARFQSGLGDTFNILLTGRDARLVGDPTLDGKRRNRRDNVYHSDVVVIAHFNLALRRLTLLSIPRDMLVVIPGHAQPESRTDFCNMDKITHVSAYGRDSLLVRTVEKNYDIRIRRRVALDFDSFRMGYALLKPFLGRMSFGDRELNTPDEALMFVRDRRHYANDDLDRGRHAVLFIKTILQRLWPRLDNRFIEWLVAQSLALLGSDTDLSADDVRYIIRELKTRKFRPDSIETAVMIGAEGPVTLYSYGQTLSCCLPVYDENEKQIAYYVKDRLDVQAWSFMEQNQRIRWPGYVFENYDFMPDTTRIDTMNPAWRKLRTEKDTLRKDTLHLRRKDSTGRDSLAPRPAARPETTAAPTKLKPAQSSQQKSKKKQAR
jgi:hypothetical protein